MKVNVGTIGHVDHGKTTLTAALVRVLGDEMARQCVIVDGGSVSIADDLDYAQGYSVFGGRPKNAKHKAAWRAKLKAAQLAAIRGGISDE